MRDILRYYRLGLGQLHPNRWVILSTFDKPFEDLLPISYGLSLNEEKLCDVLPLASTEYEINMMAKEHY